MTPDIHAEKILILDFGSQYTQLIARRVRESKVYCEIYPYNMTVEQVKTYAPAGIILSGGPASTYGDKAPHLDPAILGLEIPVLGICYGMQFMADALGGDVKRAEKYYSQAYDFCERSRSLSENKLLFIIAFHILICISLYNMSEIKIKSLFSIMVVI